MHHLYRLNQVTSVCGMKADGPRTDPPATAVLYSDLCKACLTYRRLQSIKIRRSK